MRTSREEFNFFHPVRVRYRDIDDAGHAHHSLALVYVEEARAAYWREVVGRSGLDDIDYVIAEVWVRFHQRVLYPQLLDVGLRVSALGKKHWTMQYEVFSEAGESLISARSVQVMYDHGAGRSKRIPAEIRERMEAHDGPLPSRSRGSP